VSSHDARAHGQLYVATVPVVAGARLGEMIPGDLPKVSVMIPTFNQERLIAGSIESALRQDYPNLEIVVSDDCSSDNTCDVVKQYLADGRLVYFRNETNLGRVANYRKTLYERVSGEWALNLDGDDHFYADDAISHMMSEVLAHRDKNLVAVLGSHVAMNTERGIGVQPYSNYPTGVFTGLDIFLNWNQLSFGHLATLYRVDLARAIDYYRLNTISSDWESILRLILHGDVIVTGKVIGSWNIHGNNATVTRSMAEGIRDYSYIEETYNYALERGKVNPRNLDRWFRKMIRFQTAVLWNSSGGNSEKFELLLPHVWRTYPFAMTALSSPKTGVKMVLSIYPPLFFKLRDLYRRTGIR
jgi:glycosyltransferase involved in cell wall biosynthesis